LQAGTLHFLGQNFARAFDVRFANPEGQLDYVWGTSWGVTTRLMGALVMVHSDNDGLLLPPKLAPYQVVIVPIYKSDADIVPISERADSVKKALEAQGISVKFDARDTHKPGWKFAEYELKGIPVRIAIGPKDLQNNTLEIARRDTREKSIIEVENATGYIEKLMSDIQQNFFERAKKFREENTHYVDSYDEFKRIINEKGGFIYAHWDGSTETEEKIKEETKATIRCIPPGDSGEQGNCMVTGKPSSQRVIFARAY